MYPVRSRLARTAQQDNSEGSNTLLWYPWAPWCTCICINKSLQMFLFAEHLLMFFLPWCSWTINIYIIFTFSRVSVISRWFNVLGRYVYVTCRHTILHIGLQQECPESVPCRKKGKTREMIVYCILLHKKKVTEGTDNKFIMEVA